MVHEGQIWSFQRYSNEWRPNDQIEVRNLRGKKCELYNLTRGCYGNRSYDIDRFSDESDWLPMATAKTKCAECDTNPVIEGDFLCETCREKIPVSGRMIATLDGDATIVEFSYDQGRLTLSAQGRVEIESKDAPKAFTFALQRFLDTAT